jgi:hypothetical protein
MNILLIIFNRPKLTARVFEEIRKARPEKLFIAADGPRENKPGENALCEESRKIAHMVDWPCEVSTNFQEKNMGCKMHVSSAITWFFDHVEQGIILEDDCLPVPSFFTFCSELLETYKSDERILHINGTDFLAPEETSPSPFDYRFSRCAHVWGWATWRRAWKKYDIHMSRLATLAQSDDASKMFLVKKHFDFWMAHCAHIGEKNIDTWDAQWQYSIMYNDGIVISPRVNLVQNIGFGVDATHTTSDEQETFPLGNIDLPLRNPETISVDMEADKTLMKKIYIRSFWKKAASKIKKYGINF